jgi:hypothetical protein
MPGIIRYKCLPSIPQTGENAVLFRVISRVDFSYCNLYIYLACPISRHPVFTIDTPNFQLILSYQINMLQLCDHRVTA